MKMDDAYILWNHDELVGCGSTPEDVKTLILDSLKDYDIETVEQARAGDLYRFTVVRMSADDKNGCTTWRLQDCDVELANKIEVEILLLSDTSVHSE